MTTLDVLRKQNVLIITPLITLQIFIEGRLGYFIDGAANPKNWMKFVDCAYHPAEQNLQLIQQEQFLYYEAISLITEGEELKVWYGEGYRMFMGIPLGIKSGSDCE